MKFKEGDKVVLADFITGPGSYRTSRGTNSVTKSMWDLAQKNVYLTIKYADFLHRSYLIREDIDTYTWTDEWLVPYVHPLHVSEEDITFKPGDVVQLKENYIKNKGAGFEHSCYGVIEDALKEGNRLVISRDENSPDWYKMTNGYGWAWHKSWLEPYKENPKYRYKFKPGDKVVLKPEFKVSKTYHQPDGTYCTLNSQMANLISEVPYLIVHHGVCFATTGKVYIMSNDKSSHNWAEEWLELYVEPEVTWKKSDYIERIYKPGDKVLLKNLKSDSRIDQCYVTASMAQLANTVVTITDYGTNYYDTPSYYIREHVYDFTEGMIKGLATPSEITPSCEDKTPGTKNNIKLNTKSTNVRIIDTEEEKPIIIKSKVYTIVTEE